MWEGLACGRSLYVEGACTWEELVHGSSVSSLPQVTGTGSGLPHASTVAADYFNADYIPAEIVQKTKSVF